MTSFAYKVKSGRFDFGNRSFRYAPHPQDDELLSSWLVRTAHEHLTDPATLVNLYLPEHKNNFWNRDVDVTADDKLVVDLSRKSGFGKETVFDMTLKSYEGYLSERIYQNTRNIFIQPIVSRGRIKTKGGLRYCPLCLKEDEMPYFRKKWRLSFSTACVRHGCYLMEHCPECGTPLTIYRRLRDYDFPHCRKCGFSYSNACPELVGEGLDGLGALKRLYDILDGGVFVYEGGCMYSFHFFMIVRQLVKIIYYWNRGEGIRDDVFEKGKAGWEKEKPKERLLESIPLKWQHALFSGIMKVLDGYPGELKAFCEENGLGKTELTRDLPYVPYGYKMVSDVFNRERYAVTTEEIRSVISYLKNIGIRPSKKKVCMILGVLLGVRRSKAKRRKELAECLKDANG